MADNKAQILNPADFLSAVSCKPMPFEVDGIHMLIRGLEYTEIQTINAKYSKDNLESAFQAVKLGLVEPQLNDAQRDALRQANAKFIVKLSQQIMAISGLQDEDKNGPLAGDGS